MAPSDSSSPLRLAVTPGEPSGIGPDILIQLIQNGYPHELVAIADANLLEDRAHLLKLPLRLREVNFDEPPQALAAGELAVLPIPLTKPVVPGALDTHNAHYVLRTLEAAIHGCEADNFAALITGPVHKGVINDAGIAFKGHTEFLAEQTFTDRVVMMLATEGLRVALVTTHLPLKDVPKAITHESVEQTLKIVHRSLQDQFGIVEPNILVCGLNPHAGEGGHLGYEEIEIITPVIHQLRDQVSRQIDGPLPADTLFTPKYLDGADAVVAMYHDQGLPVLKHLGFGQAVNITLGLPIIRTSVDHGTAIDLAGSGKADTGSLKQAIRVAEAMAIGKKSAR